MQAAALIVTLIAAAIFLLRRCGLGDDKVMLLNGWDREKLSGFKPLKDQSAAKTPAVKSMITSWDQATAARKIAYIHA